MKQIILSIVFCCVISNMMSQIIVEIDSIHLSNVVTLIKPKYENKYFIEGLYDGPVVDFFISFINTTDTIISLDFYNDFGYFYYIGGVKYKSIMDYPLWLNENQLILKPHIKQTFCFVNEYLYYYKSNEANKVNFQTEIVEIIPTLRFFVKYSESTMIISDNCKKVVLEEPYRDNGIIYNYKMRKIKRKLSKVIK